ncbi:hypothetical protein [Bacillus alkalicellulosilyticus]|uniref:hypothetical protein n=1 Tax=Alkalihalobacterium alkalicellulosilyticum TaxID=1912214 RepID=UPI0009981131|nr:hypothetical protein [Bacillus alkalicellulosilyticus]
MDKKQLLNDLKNIVLTELPNAVKEIKLDTRDKVCYIALFGSDYEPILGLIQLGIESYRNEVIENYGIDDKGVLWNSAEMPANYQNIIRNSEFDEKQKNLEKMLASDDWEEIWEECQTIRFELAQEFNKYNWNEILPITDDFVVFSEWEEIDVINGDLKRSIPKEKLNKLKDKNLI